MGGLSRRAYLLNKFRKEESRPVLILDAGAMLFPQPFIAPPLFNAKIVQADGLIEAMTKMGYDAYGLAPQDLSAGSSFLLKQPSERHLPWLSMNLVKKEGDELLFTPYLIKTVGDISVGMLALTGTVKSTPGLAPFIDYQTIPWENTLKKNLAMVKDQTDMIILLSSLPEKTNREIAEKFNDIHLIIQSGQSTANLSPQLYNNTLITQIGSRGKYVGQLDIQWSDSKKWGINAVPQVKQARDRLDRINWQIGRLKKRSPSGNMEQNAQYEQLLLEKNRILTQLKELELQQPDTHLQLSTFKNRFIGLPVSLPENPEIREIVLKTKLEVNNTNRQTLANTKQKQTQKEVQEFSNLAGWRICQSCHASQTKFWKTTAHAKAWRTLEQVDQQFNPDCLICHVTLPTYVKETVIKKNMLANLKDDLKGVGCETCHGPAKNHAQQPEKHSPRKPIEMTCITCHTPERDDNFIFSEKLEKIRCPAMRH